MKRSPKPHGTAGPGIGSFGTADLKITHSLAFDPKERRCTVAHEEYGRDVLLMLLVYWLYIVAKIKGLCGSQSTSASTYPRVP